MTTGHELMRHALGVHEYSYFGGSRWKKPYRNHFVAGADDQLVWDELVMKGYATKRNGNALTDEMPVYYVTDAGRAAAIAGISFKKKWGYGAPTNA